MCGRYTLTLSLEALQKAFPGVKFHIEQPPRFNNALTQMIPVIREDANRALRAGHLKWELIPSWSKDESIREGVAQQDVGVLGGLLDFYASNQQFSLCHCERTLRSNLLAKTWDCFDGRTPSPQRTGTMSQ
jgi:hypothetical protein